MKLKLTGKILTPTFIIITVSMILTAVVSIQSASNALKSKVQDEMAYMVTSKADEVSKWLDRNYSDMTNWSNNPLYTTLLESEFTADEMRQAANNYMRQIIKDYPHISGLRLTDRYGSVVASSAPKNIGVVNVSKRGYFKKAIKGQLNKSEIIVSKTSGNPIFTIAVPVKADDRILGVLYCVVDISKFQQSFIDSMKIGASGYAYMIDDSGMLFTHPDQTLIMNRDLSKLDFGQKILSTDHGLFEYTNKDVEKLAAVAKIKNADWKVVVNSPLAEIYGPAVRLRNKLITVSGVVLAVLCMSIWGMIVRFVIRPVQKVSIGLKDIASGAGDLTQRLEVSGDDEIAQLASHFNTFVDQQKEIIRNIGEKASGLSSSASQLSTLSQQMLAGTNETRHRANAVSEAAIEMSANMDSVAAATAQAAGNVGKVTTSVDEMSSTVAEIAKSATEANSVTVNAVAKVDVTSENVKKLGDATLEINKVTEVITEISEQTNLLALNATIEAARAGEAGKGFAVVAGEIKDLANQTASATKEIRTQIENVQTSTTTTVNEIKEISDTIKNVNQLVSSIAAAVEEQATVTEDITQNISQTDEGIQEVNQNIAGTNEVSGQIASDIQSVDQAAADISGNSEELKENAAGLTQVAQALTDTVDRFKL